MQQRVLPVEGFDQTIWSALDNQEQVIRVSFQLPAGELIDAKNHPYRQLFNLYLAGNFTVLQSVPVQLPEGDFRQAILQQLRQVPAGQTVSYGTLAQQAGFPGAARAVGSVCKRNPLPIIIPCHRVIKSDGRLGGYAFGVKLKQQLLRHEGLNF